MNALGVAQNWWKEAIIYHILVASFKDTNDDGLGDLPGILSKLDYLHDLGVDTICMTPIHDSPQVDMGYDVRDYEKVYKPFGTLADMENLIQGCHERGMRILIDLVINHTSDQHVWFEESKRSKDSPKRNWYIWRPARYDQSGKRMAPNNWQSCFSEAAWTWHEPTQEYYLHLFLPQQPDLNWENPETRTAIYDTSMRFWLDRGVDGFRIDAVNMISKPFDLPDAPVSNPTHVEQRAHSQFYHGPRMHEYLREIQQSVFNSYGDIVTIGELPATPDPNHVLKYVSASDRQLSMVFQFDLAALGMGTRAKFEYEPFPLTALKRAVSKWQSFLPGTDGWTTVFLETHDLGRSVTRFTSDDPKFCDVSAKLLSILMCTLTGTLILYQGQEIGMVNAPREWGIEEYKDVDSRNYYDMIYRERGSDPNKMADVMESMRILARDHARLPMQWDESSNAGFTSANAKPWMRIHDNFRAINVERQLHDEDSTLNFWKAMLTLRKEHKALFMHGDFKLFDPENNNTFIYEKISGNQDNGEAVIVLNFTSTEQSFIRPIHLEKESLRLITSNYGFATTADGAVVEEGLLKPYEGRVYLTMQEACT